MTLNLNDLIEGTEYEFRVVAVNKKGESEPSLPCDSFVCKAPFSKPGAPNGLQITDIFKHNVEISWRSPDTDGGSPIITYIIEIKAPGTGRWQRVNRHNVKENKYTISGLKEGHRYDIRVLAENAAGTGPAAELTGERSARATPAGDQPKIKKPPADVIGVVGSQTTLKCTFDNGGVDVDVKWFKGAKELYNTKKYNLMHNQRESSLTIRDVAANDDNQYLCEISNSVGKTSAVCKLSAIEPAKVELDRSYPGGLLSIKMGGSHVVTASVTGVPAPKVTWYKDSAPLIDGFARVDSGDHSTTLNLQGVPMEALGTYCVVAENEAGTSSAEFKVVVKGKPSPPERVKVVSCTKTSAALEWSPPVSNGGCPITGYAIEKKDMTIKSSDWTSAGSTTDVQTTIQRLAEGHKYLFRVFAENDCGASEPTITKEPVTVKLPYCEPDKPLNLSTKNQNRTGLTLTWQTPARDGGKPITGYVIERARGTSARWVKVNKDRVRLTEYDVNDLVEGTEYSFRVKAENEAGFSEPVEIGPIAAKSPFDTPSAPGKPSVEVLTTTTASLSWTAPSKDGGTRITHYIIEYRMQGFFHWREEKTTGAATKHSIEGLSKGSKYTFRVKAVNEAGEGPSSDETEPVHIMPPGSMEAPTVNNLEPVTAKMGASTHLECIVTGKPSPEVIWKKNGRQIYENRKYHFQFKDGRANLTIYDVGEDEAGEYSVDARNEHGRDKKTAVLTVLAAPAFRKECMGMKETIQVADTRRITVRFSGVPAPDVEWKKDGSSVKGLQIESTATSSTLILKNSDRKHDGLYTISLKNKAGSATTDLILHVQGVPDAPEGPIGISKMEHDSVTIHWHSPKSDGGSPLTDYVIEKQQLPGTFWNKVATVGPSSHSCKLSFLIIGTEYRFRVSARNAVGLSSPTTGSPVTIKSADMVDEESIKPKKIIPTESKKLEPEKPKRPDVVELVRQMLTDAELVKPVKIPIQMSYPKPKKQIRKMKDKTPSMPTKVILPPLPPILLPTEPKPMLIKRTLALPPPPPQIKKKPQITLPPYVATTSPKKHQLPLQPTKYVVSSEIYHRVAEPVHIDHTPITKAPPLKPLERTVWTDLVRKQAYKRAVSPIIAADYTPTQTIRRRQVSPSPARQAASEWQYVEELEEYDMPLPRGSRSKRKLVLPQKDTFDAQMRVFNDELKQRRARRDRTKATKETADFTGSIAPPVELIRQKRERRHQSLPPVPIMEVVQPRERSDDYAVAPLQPSKLDRYNELFKRQVARTLGNLSYSTFGGTHKLHLPIQPSKFWLPSHEYHHITDDELARISVEKKVRRLTPERKSPMRKLPERKKVLEEKRIVREMSPDISPDVQLLIERRKRQQKEVLEEKRIVREMSPDISPDVQLLIERRRRQQRLRSMPPLPPSHPATTFVEQDFTSKTEQTPFTTVPPLPRSRMKAMDDMFVKEVERVHRGVSMPPEKYGRENVRDILQSSDIWLQSELQNRKAETDFKHIKEEQVRREKERQRKNHKEEVEQLNEERSRRERERDEQNEKFKLMLASLEAPHKMRDLRIPTFSEKAWSIAEEDERMLQKFKEEREKRLRLRQYSVPPRSEIISVEKLEKLHKPPPPTSAVEICKPKPIKTVRDEEYEIEMITKKMNQNIKAYEELLKNRIHYSIPPRKVSKVTAPQHKIKHKKWSALYTNVAHKVEERSESEDEEDWVTLQRKKRKRHLVVPSMELFKQRGEARVKKPLPEPHFTEEAEFDSGWHAVVPHVHRPTQAEVQRQRPFHAIQAKSYDKRTPVADNWLSSRITRRAEVDLLESSSKRLDRSLWSKSRRHLTTPQYVPRRIPLGSRRVEPLSVQMLDRKTHKVHDSHQKELMDFDIREPEFQRHRMSSRHNLIMPDWNPDDATIPKPRSADDHFRRTLSPSPLRRGHSPSRDSVHSLSPLRGLQLGRRASLSYLPSSRATPPRDVSIGRFIPRASSLLRTDDITLDRRSSLTQMTTSIEPEHHVHPMKETFIGAVNKIQDKLPWSSLYDESVKPMYIQHKADVAGPPTGLDIMEKTRSSVTLCWKKPLSNGGSNIDTYIIERSEGRYNVWMPVDEVSSLKYKYRITGLMEAHRYSFRVAAVNGMGIGHWAYIKVAPLNPRTKPGPPSGPLLVTKQSSSSVFIEWGPPTNTGGAEILGYQLEKMEANRGRWISLADLKTNQCSYTVEHVTPGTTTQFRVAAENICGVGQFIESSSSVSVDKPLPPGPPRGPVRVTNLTSNSATIQWNAPLQDGGSCLQRYVIEKSEGGRHSVWIHCGYTGTDTRSYKVINLSEGKKWFIRISAENENGRGDPLTTSVITEHERRGWARPPIHQPPLNRNPRSATGASRTATTKSSSRSVHSTTRLAASSAGYGASRFSSKRQF